MILIGEVKESGDVEAQFGRVLEEEKHQPEAAHAAAEDKTRSFPSSLARVRLFSPVLHGGHLLE